MKKVKKNFNQQPNTQSVLQKTKTYKMCIFFPPKKNVCKQFKFVRNLFYRFGIFPKNKKKAKNVKKKNQAKTFSRENQQETRNTQNESSRSYQCWCPREIEGKWNRGFSGFHLFIVI